MEKLLTTRQVAEMLNIKPVTLKVWRIRGQGPAWVKVGSKAVRYHMADIQDFIRSTSRAALASSKLRTTA